MRTTIPALVMAVLATSIETPPVQPSKTRSLYEVTGEMEDLRTPKVGDKTARTYVDALQFPPNGEGETKPILECHGCVGDSVTLEITSELGSIGLGPSDLASQGRIIGKIRHVDWNPFHEQKELQLNCYSQAAYVWVAGKPAKDSLYDAAIVRITKNGKRKAVVNGHMWFCSHPGSSHPPGKARWHPKGECKRPSEPGRVQPLDFHLTSWFPCSQGCCVFQDS